MEADMKRLAATVALLILSGAAWTQSTTDPQSSSPATTPAGPPSLAIRRSGTQPPVSGPESNFTGRVRVETSFRASPPARASGGTVVFEPGARTAWHTHPLGQTLIVTAGVGRVQQWGGSVEEIRPGDVVWIPPGMKHWHGAAPTSGMTHIAISEQLDGKSVDWLEKVGDEQYR
jgi:quercetin dioxygenase-like cupin family protein